jgi:hypothetical protein
MTSSADVEAMLDLYPTLVSVLREHGTLTFDGLVARTRLRRRDQPVDPRLVAQLVYVDPTLVPRPDGRVSWLGEVLDGIVLTHRVRARVERRHQLWLSTSVVPLFEIAMCGPLPLETGGEVRAGLTQVDTLVADHDWLPRLRPGDLLALQWLDGVLSVRAVTEEELAGEESREHARTLLLDHCPVEPPEAEDDVRARNASLLTHALGQARLEDPDLLTAPHPPLEELLATPGERLDLARPDRHANDPSAPQLAGGGRPHLVVLPGGAEGSGDHRPRPA